MCVCSKQTHNMKLKYSFALLPHSITLINCVNLYEYIYIETCAETELEGMRNADDQILIVLSMDEPGRRRRMRQINPGDFGQIADGKVYRGFQMFHTYFGWIWEYSKSSLVFDWKFCRIRIVIYAWYICVWLECKLRWISCRFWNHICVLSISQRSILLM